MSTTEPLSATAVPLQHHDQRIGSGRSRTQGLRNGHRVVDKTTEAHEAAPRRSQESPSSLDAY